MIELLVHLPVLILVVIDLWMHYQHHKKRKQALESQKLYTLDEARIELFPEALEHGNKLCACTGIREEIRR